MTRDRVWRRGISVTVGGQSSTAHLVEQTL